MYRLKFIAEVSRFAGFDDLIANVCFVHGVGNNTDVSRGWLINTYRVELYGNKDSVGNAYTAIKLSLREYSEKFQET